MTFEQYLDWADNHPGQYEFHGGNVIVMGVGTTKEHEAVVLNMAAAIRGHLGGRAAPCRLYLGGVCVRVDAADKALYPDLHVTCHPDDRQDSRSSRHPVVIIEVLSKTTRDYDRGDKFDAYAQLESLQEYILIDSLAQAVSVHRRIGAHEWRTLNLGPDGTLAVEALQFSLPVAQIYDETDVPLPRLV